jgi:pantothenate kinase
VDSTLIERAHGLIDRGGRVLGIAGAPGAGKSTLAAELLGHFGDRAQLLPLDGFHLADDELTRRGLLGCKGAPDTFDVHGYIAALQRVRLRTHSVVVPRFDRHLEAAIAGSICIDPDVQLVITEGNYLLLDVAPWSSVSALLDERWMVEIDESKRIELLVARHVAHGRSIEGARQWVTEVDEPNALLIRERSAVADLLVTPTCW